MNIDDTLFRAGTVALQKHAETKEYTKQTWERNGRFYHIVRRVGGKLFLRWAAFGAYPPRDSSEVHTIGEFIKLYKIAKKGV